MPDPAATTAATRAIIESLGFCQITRIWVAPDGGCCFMLRQDGREMAWQADVRGRLIGKNWTSPERGLSSEPLGEFHDGSILLNIQPYSGEDPAPSYLVRERAGKTEATSPWIRTNAPSHQTVLVDDIDVVHLFGSRGFIVFGYAYVRYGTVGNQLRELSHKLFNESTVVVRDSGHRYVKLRPAPPGWGWRWGSTLQWDGHGRVVGAVRGYMVYRLRLPECEMSDSVDFPAESAATRQYFNIDDQDMHMVKSTPGYWLFVPTRSGGEAMDSTRPSVYVCRLDASLKPIRPSAATIETVRQYSEAPKGSIVRIDVTHESKESWHPELGGDSAWHTFTLRFLAFGPDGHIYSTETRDSLGFIEHATPRDTSVRVTGGGDSVGHAIITLPAFPRTAGYFTGTSLVTAFVNAKGETDSVQLTPQGTKWFNDAAMMAARKTRLTGRIFRAGGHGVACDITYRFESGEKLDEPQTVSVGSVRVRAD